MKRIRIYTSGIAFLVMTAIVLSPTRDYSWADRIDMSSNVIAEENKVADIMKNDSTEVNIVSAKGINNVIDEDIIDSEPVVSNVLSNYSNCKVGDIVKFGRYEQDGNSANGQEEIEWIVLKVEPDRVLLISKYALDRKTYNFDYCDVTWETCSLRNWLNNDFKNSAFTPEEQEMIPTVSIVNDANTYYGTDGGNQTEDQIFCLSADEVKEYMGYTSYNDNDQCGFGQTLVVEPTQYAIDHGAAAFAVTENDYNGYLKGEGYSDDVIGRTGSWWWLRSSGCSNKNACYVSFDGIAGPRSDINVDRDSFAVRPALYIGIQGTAPEITDEIEDVDVPPIEDTDPEVVPEVDIDREVPDDTNDIESISDRIDSDVITEESDTDTEVVEDESDSDSEDIIDGNNDTDQDVIDSDSGNNDADVSDDSAEVEDTPNADVDVTEDNSDTDISTDAATPESEDDEIINDSNDVIVEEPNVDLGDDVILNDDTSEDIIDESAEEDPDKGEEA